MNFSERLDTLLKERGISNYKMAKATGISDSLIGYWRKGTRSPTAEKLLTIANYLEVSIDYLLKGENSIQSNDFTELENNLIDMFRFLDSRDRNDVYEIVRLKYERIARKKASIYSTYIDADNLNKGEKLSSNDA